MKPVLQALVLAEHVYTDKTGKKIIAGTFNRVTFRKSLPIVEQENPDGTKQTVIAGGMQGGSPYAYISVTAVCDNTKLQLQFVSLSRNEVLLQQEITLKCNDRLETLELVAPLPILPCFEAGVYAFEVMCEGEIIGSYRIIAREAE